MARKSNKAKSSPAPAPETASVDLDAQEAPLELGSSESPPESLSDHDGAVWEDEPGFNLAIPHEKSPSPSSSPRVALVRKRKGGKTVFVAQQNANRRYPWSKAKAKNIGDEPSLVDIDPTKLRGAVKHGASYTVEYAFDVLKTALTLLRKPLGILLFIYLLSLLFSQLGSAFRTVLSPFCWIPGISRTPVCAVPAAAPKVPKWADYPKLVEMQGSRFEQLLDESVGNSGISLDIKRAEMATSDLITLVRVSDLKSKSALADHLNRFVADAKKTGRDLQRLSSRIAGAVDNVIAVNDYALHTIESHESKSSTGLSILWPFSSRTSVHEIVRATFTDALSVLETQIRRIVLEAEVALRDLTTLEEHLYTLSEFVARENGTLAEARAELLGALWTMVGGNKRRLRHMDGHLFLLSSVGEYRKRALAHVSAALQTLQGMSEDMEDLRERVAAPELVGERIPVEVHMRSIRAGLARLQADRERTKEREEEAVRRILGIEAGDDE